MEPRFEPFPRRIHSYITETVYPVYYQVDEQVVRVGHRMTRSTSRPRDRWRDTTRMFSPYTNSCIGVIHAYPPIGGSTLNGGLGRFHQKEGGESGEKSLVFMSRSDVYKMVDSGFRREKKEKSVTPRACSKFCTQVQRVPENQLLGSRRHFPNIGALR